MQPSLLPFSRTRHGLNEGRENLNFQTGKPVHANSDATLVNAHASLHPAGREQITISNRVNSLYRHVTKEFPPRNKQASLPFQDTLNSKLFLFIDSTFCLVCISIIKYSTTAL